VKLVVQIPCLNEEQTLPATLGEIPREIPGVDEVLILVINDGSTDATSKVARMHGADYVLEHSGNQGLGRAFRTGIDQALKMGADIIVNTDGDGQYVGADIAALIEPILRGEADIVVGDRQTANIAEFSASKKFLQWLGSHTVRALSDTDIPDAVSGFRAISRSAALHLNILSKFSYTVEMIIQAGNKQMNIVSVPVRVNRKTRDSRLFRNTRQFILNQAVGMLRMYAMYRPMRFFFYIATTISLIGLIPVLRFLFGYFTGDGQGHIQSLILGGSLMIMGFIVYVTGLLSDLISQNRQLTEIALNKIRQLELQDETGSSLRPGSTPTNADPNPD